MLTMTDLFCGAGGSSTGAVEAGIDVRIAANHWKLAVESHHENHTRTAHDCADISQVDPRRYAPTDVLWASPECTNHSQAKGQSRKNDGQPDLFGEVLPDAASERSRATMWDVPRFAEAMLLRGRPYRAVVVENVVEAVAAVGRLDEVARDRVRADAEARFSQKRIVDDYLRVYEQVLATRA